MTFPPKLVPRLLLKLSEGGDGMARKRYNEEDILRLLREIEVHLYGGMDVVSARRTRHSLEDVFDGVP